LTERRAIDRVRVDAGEIVEIPWASRQALLARLRPLEGMREIVGAFEAVGVSRSVELSGEQKAVLLEELDAWAEEAELPEGLEPLRLALADD